MALNPQNCKKGEEQWEEFTSRITADHKEESMFQYDYRNSKGELFSCISPTLEHARRRKDRWIKNHGE